MRKRTVKKMLRQKAFALQIQGISEELQRWANDSQNNMRRLNWLIKEQTSLISRFPIKVEDFETNPPIHNGQYLVWFVRKDGVSVRFYSFVGGRWFDSQKNEVNIKALYPSCYLTAPVLSEDAIEVYRRRCR